MTKRKHSSQPIRMIPPDKCSRPADDADRAFAALERAVPLHWWRAATWMHRLNEVAILRGDPRLATLKKRMGLLER